MYTLHGRHDGVCFHYPYAASDHSEVGDQRRGERFALYPVHGNVGQRHVYHGGDRERVLFDAPERAVGDGQNIDGGDECLRRQFVRGEIFQNHLTHKDYVITTIERKSKNDDLR